jgi:NAD-dependent deacetylase
MGNVTTPTETIPDELAGRLKVARRVVVLTGAGISAESGVPTFRQAQTGLWAQYDPEELATPQAFHRNPKRVWDWYSWRRELVAKAMPNDGHLALTEIERLVPEFTLITQNVDSLHQRAGTINIIELHGNLNRIKCANEDRIVSDWREIDGHSPVCPHCGGYLRPDVVWFGETLSSDILNRAIQAAREAEIFLTIGTSGIVYPAASLPLEAIRLGAIGVEINPETTPLSNQMTYSLRGPSGSIIPALLAATWPNRSREGHFRS